MSQVTLILDRAWRGDPKAAEELLPLVYQELRRLAAHKMTLEAEPDAPADCAGSRSLAASGR